MNLVKRKNCLNRGFPLLFEDLLHDDLFQFPFGNVIRKSNLPAVNVKESDTAFLIEVAAPGMNKKDFNISVKNNVLTISTEKKTETTDSNESAAYTRKEFGCQSFERSFSLPERLVNKDKIKAKYEDGILHLEIPKMEKEQESVRNVTVR